MSGHIKKDKFQNDYIWENVDIVPIKKKRMETKLWWFGHVQRRPLKVPVRRVNQMVSSPIKRGRGRSKGTLGEVY